MGVNNLRRHAVAGNRTHDLLIVSPTPYHGATTPLTRHRKSRDRKLKTATYDVSSYRADRWSCSNEKEMQEVFDGDKLPEFN